MNQEINLGKHLKICSVCGRDYRVYENDDCTNSEEICPACAKFKELDFIRQTLLNNPSLNILSLSKETGIPTSRILKYIQEEHIITRDN